MTRRLELVQMPASREPMSLLSVDRSVSELRRGRMIAIRGHEGQAALMLAAEAVTDADLKELAEISQGTPQLIVTARRAAVLDIIQGAEHAVILNAGDSSVLTAELAAHLCDPLSSTHCDEMNTALDSLKTQEAELHSIETAAVQFAKIARLLPAAIIASIKDPTADDLDAWVKRHDLFLCDAGDVFQYDNTVARSLSKVSEARVPLENAEDTRIIAFRPADGGLEHLAIIIGQPATDEPVLVRLHSECFTGDLLASLKCDCGDQLRGAISEISTKGSGIMLYLAQEGRGIGLVNKLRAYELQDRGFDTLDANEQLGFDADERVYLPAAQMLHALGFNKIHLMTNNPDKVTALSSCGMDVSKRVPHAFPTNKHNEQYLSTKEKRSGHLF
ncbi:MAG: GTP cyclohydrolase II [Rhodospirillales bacterium]|jgi:GTP cyclohydrolase II|nr:GTP cyclohydrolase II [Rhodospirillales bacterium]